MSNEKKENLENIVDSKDENSKNMTYCAYARMPAFGRESNGRLVSTTKIVTTNSKEEAEKCIERFKERYKEDIKCLREENTWIISFPKMNNITWENIELQNKVESLYDKITEQGIYDTPNGNFIFNLNELKLTDTEEDLFLNMLKGDSRINDLEIDKESKEADIIFYLGYCPNIGIPEEYEDLKEIDDDEEEEEI